MMDKEDYKKWLINNRAVKEYSANRYANAIDTISSEIGGYGLEQLNLYVISDTTIIDRILIHPEFQKKDTKGNRMYSTALKHFKTYMKQFKATNLDKKSQFGMLEEEVSYGDENVEYEEGKELLRLHKMRERDPQLIKEAKKRFKKIHGELICEACGINFEKVYGERGKDFIEGHHRKPVSEMKEGETTKVEDIGMLCSNCHRMIHRIPMISIEELKMSLKINWVGISYGD